MRPINADKAGQTVGLSSDFSRMTRNHDAFPRMTRNHGTSPRMTRDHDIGSLRDHMGPDLPGRPLPHPSGGLSCAGAARYPKRARPPSRPAIPGGCASAGPEFVLPRRCCPEMSLRSFATGCG